MEYQSLSKRTEELIESQEAEMGFSLFDVVDKEVEEGARNIMSQDFEISNNDEHSASAVKLSVVIIILPMLNGRRNSCQVHEYSLIA